MVGGDEAHPAHVGGQRVDVVDAAGGLEGLLAQPEIEELELVGVDRGVLGLLEVDAAHPVAALLEVGHEVVADEPAGAGHEYSLHDQISSARPSPDDRRHAALSRNAAGVRARRGTDPERTVLILTDPVPCRPSPGR